MLAGPPCETWSAAKCREIPTAKNPPRPLSSRETHWGLSCLSQRECDQVDTGNQLLRATILFLCVAINYRAPAVMERPSAVEDARRTPCSWPLPEMQRALPLPDVNLVHFHQCLLLNIFVKPAALPCACAPQVATLISEVPDRSRCNRPAGCRKEDVTAWQKPRRHMEDRKGKYIPI